MDILYYLSCPVLQVTNSSDTCFNLGQLTIFGLKIYNESKINRFLINTFKSEYLLA